MPRSGVLRVSPGVLGIGPDVLVILVVVVPGGGIVLTVAGVRTDAELRTQPVEVRVVALVLELTGDLNLLGLGSAAPHWLDPLERPEPVRPHDLRLAGFVRHMTSVRHMSPSPPRNGERDVHQHPYRYNRTRFAPLMPTLIPSCLARFRAAAPHRTSGARLGGPRPPMGALRRSPRSTGPSPWW